MRKLLVAAAVAMLGIGSARAQGFDFAVRAAYAFPLGDISGEPDSAIGDLLDGAIPFWVEGNYRITPSVELGAYYQYAVPLWASASGARSGYDMRAGLQLNYLLAPRAALAPWVGVGAGWEWLNALKASDVSETFDGFDFMLQGGVEYKVASAVRVGPFVALSMGEYRNIDAPGSPSEFKKGWHEWLQLGIRGAFGR